MQDCERIRTMVRRRFSPRLSFVPIFTLVRWMRLPLKSLGPGVITGVAVPRTDLVARSSFSSGAPSVQYTGTIYCHHSDHSLPACRVRESSYSEIYRHSHEYWAGGADGWDSLLGLVVGCDGFAARCAAHSIHHAGRRFASVLMSLVQHAGADASSDSTLGALW
jgi:hypothetical protein